jgi:sulfur carrier protein
MEIFLNGETKAVADGLDIVSLLDQLDFTGKRVAVEVNHQIIPRSSHASYLLQSGDKVEIVHAIGGG